MEYIYAAMLLHAAKQDITEDALKKVLTAAGATPDEARIKALVSSLADVNIDEAISNAAMPVAAAPAPAAPAPAEAPKEEKKESKEDEKKAEENAAAGLGALFG